MLDNLAPYPFGMTARIPERPKKPPKPSRVRLVELSQIRLHPRFEALAAIKYAVPAQAFDCEAIYHELAEHPLIVVEDGPDRYFAVSNPRDFTLAQSILGEEARVPVRIVTNSPNVIAGSYADVVRFIMKYTLGAGAYPTLGEVKNSLTDKFYLRVFGRKHTNRAFAKLLKRAYHTIFPRKRSRKRNETAAAVGADSPNLDYSNLTGKDGESA